MGLTSSACSVRSSGRPLGPASSAGSVAEAPAERMRCSLRRPLPDAGPERASVAAAPASGLPAPRDSGLVAGLGPPGSFVVNVASCRGCSLAPGWFGSVGVSWSVSGVGCGRCRAHGMFCREPTKRRRGRAGVVVRAPGFVGGRSAASFGTGIECLAAGGVPWGGVGLGAWRCSGPIRGMAAERAVRTACSAGNPRIGEGLGFVGGGAGSFSFYLVRK